jgi:hypothetical protein
LRRADDSEGEQMILSNIGKKQNKKIDDTEGEDLRVEVSRPVWRGQWRVKQSAFICVPPLSSPLLSCGLLR